MLACSIQIASEQGETKEQRLRKAAELLRRLAERDERPAQILFPEIWATGFFAFDHYRQEAEPETGDTYELMSEWAQKLNAYILTGSFVEKDGDDYYNTNLLLNPQGRLIGKYRKIHLFSYQCLEAQILSPGGGVSVVKTEYGRVGISTCYDLRFPELFRAMVNLGAGLFLVSAAWPLVRLEHWRLFNQVRAIENQCFLLSCNGTGKLAGQQLGGHSMAIDPAGLVLADGDEREGLVFAHIEPADVVAARAVFPALANKVLI